MYLIFIFCSFVLSVQGWNKFMEVPGLYQGDIQLSPDQWEIIRSNGSTPFGSIVGGRWPGGKIPYVIESSIGSRGRTAIAAAINDYHKYTCLRFFKRTNERYYISFYNGRGCNSPVGRSYRNRISLEAGGCQDKGTVLHEIGHSIGLQHEQCRPDRDGYVKIHYQNINGPWAYAFNIERNVDSLGTPYDLKSMMHYSSTAFAYRGKKTITTKDPSKQHLIDTYNRITGFSEMDIKQIGLMYKKECGGNPNPGTKPPVTEAPPTHRPTGGPPTQPPTGCDNKDRQCDYWASNGYCPQSNVVEDNYRKVMINKCCKACREKARCVDQNEKCPGWAGRGECNNNPGYMLRNCRKSCKRCS